MDYLKLTGQSRTQCSFFKSSHARKFTYCSWTPSRHKQTAPSHNRPTTPSRNRQTTPSQSGERPLLTASLESSPLGLKGRSSQLRIANSVANSCVKCFANRNADLHKPCSRLFVKVKKTAILMFYLLVMFLYTNSPNVIFRDYKHIYLANKNNLVLSKFINY